MFKKLFFISLFFASPLAAQTLEQRADKIILDANQAENAMQRVMAEAKRLKADIAKLAPPVVVVPPVVVPPVVTPPVVVVPHHSNLQPVIDLSKIPVAEVGFSELRVKTNIDVPKQNLDGTGQFRVVCGFSHMNFDDPIVWPAQEGMAHLHAWFGNTFGNYKSNMETVPTTGNSTCSGGIANRTLYWVPAVIDTKDASPVKPYNIMIYYKTGYIEGDNVRAFPKGLRMIAGDMRSTSPQNAKINWGCWNPATQVETRHESIPANCPVGATIEASIDFPFCWDGKNLDSPDHKSHMAFSEWNNDTRKVQCPSSHPVELPMIAEKINYKVTEAGAPARWRLSSDNYGNDKPGGYSLHADWWNGWDETVMNKWINNCLKANKDCHADLLGDGTGLY